MRVGRSSFGPLDKKRTTFLLASLFLILVGSRTALIGYAANSTPFMDEWDADAAFLLKPYLQGNMTLSDLFAPFNEHRVFFTKLLVISIFHISGYWDVVLQMVTNMIIDCTTIVALSYTLSRVLDGGLAAAAALIVSTLINAVPLGYDNALLGFNTHFYLVRAFSFASLWFLVDSRAWSPRWAVGVLCATGSFLCMASGALTLSVAVAGQMLQIACGRRGGFREWLGIAALTAMTITLASLVPHVPQADAFKAHSIGQFLSAFLQLASWPAPSGLGLIIFLPSALFCLRTFADRPAASDPRWFNVMALGWLTIQMLAIAKGRGQFPIQSRYFDMLLIGMTINLVSAFWLFQYNAIESTRVLFRSLALAAWLSIFALSLLHPQRHLLSIIDERRQTGEIEARNLRGYLATGDVAFLAGTAVLEIPYIDSGRLRELLDTPEIRSALPPELLSRDPPRHWVEALKRNFLRLSPVWMGLGVLLLIATVASAALAPARPRARGLEGPKEPR